MEWKVEGGRVVVDCNEKGMRERERRLTSDETTAEDGGGTGDHTHALHNHPNYKDANI